jgi:Fe2+ or Zn2+ uptake regulation protein
MAARRLQDAGESVGSGDGEVTGGSHYAASALDALRGAGLRITRPRRSVVELLEHTETALTAGAIHEALQRRRIPIDLASVYRTLAVLETQGLIRRLMTTEGVVRSEPGRDRAGCDHHVRCRRCGIVRAFACEGAHEIYRQAERQAGFSIETHALELVGLCDRCNASLA